MEISEIRKIVEGLPRARGGRLRKIPSSVRAEIIEELRKYAGSSADFANQAGLSHATISRWRKIVAPRKFDMPVRFRRVQINSESSPSRFMVEGPMGLRVPALSLEEVADLFKAVSR
jgi:hypothetical protein